MSVRQFSLGDNSSFVMIFIQWIFLFLSQYSVLRKEKKSPNFPSPKPWFFLCGIYRKGIKNVSE